MGGDGTDPRNTTGRRALWLILVAINLAGLVAAWWFGGMERRLARQTVVLIGAEQYLPGTKASLRVIVRDRDSNQPIDGANVTVSFRDSPPFEGLTDNSGTVSFQLDVPATEGESELLVAVRSRRGATSLAEPVTIAKRVRVLLDCDKPRYQPGQLIHLRALVLARGSGEAVAERTVVFEVRDPRGNRLMRREQTTSEYGIAADTFELADEVATGRYQLSVAADDRLLAQRTVTVERYTLPKFKVVLRPSRAWYRPGEVLEGSVTARYFYGKPVSGGEVTVTFGTHDVGYTRLGEIATKTAPDGVATFRWQLPEAFAGTPLEGGQAILEIDVQVVDTGGQTESVTRLLTVAASAIDAVCIPESGSLVAGVENRLYLLLTEPDGSPVSADYKLLDAAGQPVAAGRSDESGLAIIRWTPPETWGELRLRAGGEPPRPLPVGDAAESRILLRPDRAVYRVGDTCRLAALVGDAAGSVYFDVVRDGQTLLTSAAGVEDGRATTEIELSDDLAGTLTLHAYALGRSGQTIRDTRRVVVVRSRGLDLKVTVPDESHPPGGTARVDLEVRGPDGRPRVAAVGLDIVDESVFALEERLPGMAAIYFALEQELSEPRIQTKDFSLYGALRKARERPLAEADQQALAAACLAVADENTENLPGLEVDSFGRQVRRVRTVCARFFGYFWRAVGIEFVLLVLGCGYAARRRRGGKGGLGQLLLDLLVVIGVAGVLLAIALPALGGRTSKETGVVDLAVSAAEDSAGDEEMASEATPTGTAEPDVRVRQFFPETLYSNPAIITNEAGLASVEVPLADSITTWRISAIANTREGDLGNAIAGLRVFQPFFVDLDLPVALTVGDEVDIPVVVYNYLHRAQTVRLSFEPEAGFFDRISPRAATLTIGPNEVKAARLKVIAVRVGRAAIKVIAEAGDLSDAVQREVDIEPNGKVVEEVINGRLIEPTGHEVILPAEAIEGTRRLLLKVYPGIVAQLVDGLDGLLGMPYGCFEQTSSVTYPNLLVLEYLKETQQAPAETIAQAERYVNLGYQRLLSFEVDGGGFDWYGDAPAKLVLSAYGLLELTDMKKVHEVDEGVLERCRAWLWSGQKEDGSWDLDVPLDTWSDVSATLPVTAYLVWSLAETAEQSDDSIRRGAAYLIEHLGEIDDPYTMALCANALIRATPGEAGAIEAIQRLAELADGEGEERHWGSERETLTYGYQSAGVLETTALATYALIRARAEPEVAAGGLTYLINHRRPSGDWGSTQATVLALKALLAAAREEPETGTGRVQVAFNGEDVATVELTKEGRHILQTIDLTTHLRRGPNSIALRGEDGARPIYQVALSYALPWSQVSPPPRPRLKVHVGYDRREMLINDTVAASVRCVALEMPTPAMIILDVGLPPGFAVNRRDLDQLVERDAIQRYELTGRQVIFYLDGLPAPAQGLPSVTLTYRLTARFPVHALAPGSRAYGYYDPDANGESRPLPLTVLLQPRPAPSPSPSPTPRR